MKCRRQRQRLADARTEVTERILKYVTDEFNEGRAGNHPTLPSTYDVAKACVRGSGAKACRRALRHLNLLMGSGEIIRVADPDDDRSRWRRVFWALDVPGTRIG